MRAPHVPVYLRIKAVLPHPAQTMFSEVSRLPKDRRWDRRQDQCRGGTSGARRTLTANLRPGGRARRATVVGWWPPRRAPDRAGAFVTSGECTE